MRKTWEEDNLIKERKNGDLSGKRRAARHGA